MHTELPDGTDNNAGESVTDSSPIDDVSLDFDFDFSGYQEQEKTPEQDEPVENTNSEPEKEEHDFFKNIFKPEYNIPEPIQKVMRPALEDYSRGVNKKFQDIHNQYASYKAYEPFVQQNVPLEELQAAHQVFNMMRQDPEAVFKELASMVGYELTEEEAEEIAEELADEMESPLQQQLAQQQQQIAQLQEFIQQREYQTQESAVAQQLESEIQADLRSVSERYNQGKPLPQKVVQELAGRVLTKQNMGVKTTFLAEMEALAESQRRLRGSSAPRPISGNGSGGIPQSPQENQDTFENRVQRLINLRNS